MIAYERFVLDNGLTVLVHKDETTPLVAFNLLYKVGARNENPDKTGFAHLFEHLMFEGSKNIPHYDAPLQQAGGENNAFTNNNITNFYITVPKENLETAFWLESDRMLELSFSQQKLEVQKKVVIEEFKQRYLTQPYRAWNLLLRPMTYKVHPYQWPTIGKEISHIENATLEEVKAFFFGFYAPNNAILSVAGNITKKEVETLAEKWFGPIPRRNILKKKIPQEPKQTEARKETVQRPVPVNAIYQAFHMCGRNHDDYYATDLISDILSNGKSSRMNQKLVKEQKFFSSISAYITGDVDPGLFIVNGNLNPGVTFEQAETAIRQELDQLMHGKVEENELAKVKNKVEANLVYSEINILNKAMNLAYFEYLGNASIINQETQKYQQVTPVDIQRVARNIFQNSNCSTLNYQVQPS